MSAVDRPERWIIVWGRFGSNKVSDKVSDKGSSLSTGEPGKCPNPGLLLRWPPKKDLQRASCNSPALGYSLPMCVRYLGLGVFFWGFHLASAEVIQLKDKALVGGKILAEKRGDGGFGYDPVFVPLGFDQTLAQMTMEQKNSISHRAKAMNKLMAFLESNNSV